MIIVGEKLNSSIPKTLQAINNCDEEYLIKLIKDQEKFGANYLDINTAICGDNELTKLLWLIDLVLNNSNCGIMLDSPSPTVIAEAIKTVDGRDVIINSVTLTDRIDELLPVIKQTHCGVVALPIDKSGIPNTVEKRTGNSFKLIEKITDYGIEADKIYIDILVEALSVGNENAMIAIKTAKEVKNKFSEVHTICGLSNISFGLPKRININTAFLSMAMINGLDSAIMDITSPAMKMALQSSIALLGEDDYCMDYISYIRENE